MKPQLLFFTFCFLIPSILSAKESPSLPIPELSFEENIIEDEDTKITCKLRDMKGVEVNLEIKGNKTLTNCEEMKKVESSNKGMYISKTCKVEVTKEMDKMEFICEAHFKTQSPPGKMCLRSEPEFTDCPDKQVWIEGHESSFHCKAAGYPLPNVTCAKGQAKFKEGEKFKPLRNMAGTYTCTAINFDEDSKSVEVSVQFQPKISDIKVEPSMDVFEGDNVTLSCVTSGFPQPVVSWPNLNSEVELSPDQHEIKIWGIKKKHEGNYSCTAQNKHGTVTQSRQITLSVKPKVLSINVKPSAVVSEGENLTLTCVAQGAPRPTYRWQVPPPSTNVFFSDDSSVITISVIQKESSGDYRCIAKNKHGQDTMTKEVTVTEKGNSGHRVEMSVLAVLALLLPAGLIFCLL